MAAFALVDAEILAGPLRITGRTNSVEMDPEVDALDVTTFDSGGWRERIGGLRTVMATVDGFFDASPIETGALTPDAEIFAAVGGAQLPFTVAPTKADGSVAYIFGAREGSLDVFGEIGEPAPFNAEYWGDGVLGRGALIHPANILRTAGGTGTGVVLGTIATGRTLLVAVHVVAVSGTTPALTVTVQRDDNAGFTTPTTVQSVGPVSAPTGQLFSFPGPITPDDRYRVTWTLTGTTPSARFAAAVAVTP
jgi:hypothetical protein